MYTQPNFIYILIVLSFLLIYIFFRNQEKFTLKFHTPKDIKKKPDYKLDCILSLLDNEEGFLGSFKDNNKKAKNTLIKTNNLEGNHWKSVCNGELPTGDKIHQLFWYKQKNKSKIQPTLMCIGKNVNEEYTLYIKEADITSKWTIFTINNKPIENKMISFIIYDLNGTLLGINSKNNQIYKLVVDEDKSEWIGPINYSSNIQIKRIIYDLDKKMLGLDKNNMIWKKDNIYWETSEWKQLNYTTLTHNYINYKNPHEKDITKNILDLIHDTDGKLIGITDSNPNLIKQIDFSFNSLFTDYSNDCDKDLNPETCNELKQKQFNEKQTQNLESIDINSKTLLTKNDILMNKTGLDIEEYDYIKTDPNNKSPARKNLIDRLNFLLQLKKKLVNKCKFNNNKTHYLHYNTDAYDEISNLIQNLDSQGY
jgi:hypothetical protein